MNVLKEIKDSQEKGLKLFHSKKYEEASSFYKKCINLAKKYHYIEDEIKARNMIGKCYIFSRNQTLAKKNLLEVIRLCKKHEKNETIELAIAYCNLGKTYLDLSLYYKSLKALKKANKLCRNNDYGLNGSKVLSSTLNNLGICFRYLGKFDVAMEVYSEGLDIAKKIYHKEDIFLLYTNMSILYSTVGDYEKSILYIQQSANFIENDDWKRLANYYNGLGIALREKGENENALNYHLKSLDIRLKLKDPIPITNSYNNIAICFVKQKKYKQSLDYFQKVLKIRENKLGENHLTVAKVLVNMCELYLYMGENKIAEECVFKSLYIYENNYSINESSKIKRSFLDCYQYVGVVYRKKNDFHKSIKYLQVALNVIFENSLDSIYRNPINLNCSILLQENALEILSEKITTYWHLYQQKKEFSDLECALSTCKILIRLIDKISNGYMNENSKLALMRKVRRMFNPIYEAVYEMFKLNNSIDVLLFFEKSKATLLLSGIREEDAKKISNIPQSLLEKERYLKRELSSLDSLLIKAKTKKENLKNNKLISDLEKQQFNYRIRWELLIKNFERDYPKYFSWKYDTKTVQVKEAQKRLGINTAIVEYSIGDESVFIVLITKQNHQLVRIDKPDNFYELVKKYNKYLRRTSNNFFEASNRLYNLLIKPIEVFLKEIKNLIIVPDDVLNSVSFDAFINFELAPQFKQKQPSFADKLPYLIHRYNIQYHYSITLWHYLKSKYKENPKINSFSFLGFAPVNFGGKEKDRHRGYVASTSQKQEVFRKSFELGNLPDSEKEVLSVGGLFFEKNLEVKTHIGKEATKKDFLDNASDYTHILISTHGYKDERNTNYIGIVFHDTDGRAFSNDEIGNNILTTTETYSLELQADLVVLSSCNSGIGALRPGEGMMAINRAFLYAGASNILYTLSEVGDSYSMELVKRFFRNLLEGFSENEALSLAKREMIRLNYLPVAWSPFSLMGV